MPLKSPIKKLIINLIGWFGVSAVLLAYLLLSFSFLSSHNLIYQLLNGIGAIFLIVESAWRNDYPFTFLNVVWAAVALWAIIQIIFSFV